tara:strand:- start:26 stop:934 length:909 start_codon:yes stop_codon:yes gene_type:complete
LKTVLIATSSFSKKILSKKINFFKKKKIKVILNSFKKTLSSSQLKTFFDENLVGIISGNEILDKKILVKAKNLKIISRCGVGYNNIDTHYLEKNKIKLCLTNNEHVVATSELTLLHILASLRKFSFNINTKNFTNWSRKKGFLLNKKKIGLIGLGKIGNHLAKILAPFKCEIIYNDLKKNNKFDYAKLDTILKSCDIISVHIPLNKKTQNLINLKNLRLVKKNAILLNISRGGIINEKDLFKFLKKRPDVMVSLDCFTKEPYKGQLIKLENVTMTPHIGTFTYETRDQMEEKALKNLCKYII